jgi:hypothetical protein
MMLSTGAYKGFHGTAAPSSNTEMDGAQRWHDLRSTDSCQLVYSVTLHSMLEL